MGIFGGSPLRDLNQTLSAMHMSDNSSYGTPRQAVEKYGPSLEDRLVSTSTCVRKLVSKGKSDEARAALTRWRNEPIRPTILGTIPNMAAELTIMNQMFDDIVAGRASLDEGLARGSEAEQTRYYQVKNALERHGRWSLIIDDITNRAGL